jgi:glycosyltransferase involved in cell wall biosynthesis
LKILLFTEIYDCGGIDTFIVNLINSWPNIEDSFVIIANADYPGLNIVEKRVKRPTEIIRHNIKTYPNLFKKSNFLHCLKRFASPILRYIFICINTLLLRKLLLKSKADVLMVVNGGYPGGDSCRAASISWGMFSGKPKSIHNYHGIVQKAAWHSSMQERLVDWFLCRYVNQFVTVSRAAAESMLVRPQIFCKNLTSYIHNGLDVVSDASVTVKGIREDIGISSTTPLCLMLGTYDPGKGHLFLFKAFKKILEVVPNAHLLICGYGLPHEIKQVSGYLRDMQLNDHVHLMGFRTDISHLLDSSDVLVVASQVYESFGLTSVEAMAHKVPVVATDVGGIPEVVVNGEGGYCVGSNDVDSYARCIVLLLKDEVLRQEQGERGYKRYQDFFTAETMSSGYANIFYKLAETAVTITPE